MTPKQIRETVSRAWWALERSAGCYREFTDLLSQSERAERDHRNFGRRWTGQSYGQMYRVSVDTCARLIALQKFREGLARPVRKMSAEDARSVRSDVLTAWSLALKVRRDIDAKARRKLLADLEPIMTIDYAKDCARH